MQLCRLCGPLLKAVWCRKWSGEERLAHGTMLQTAMPAVLRAARAALGLQGLFESDNFYITLVNDVVGAEVSPAAPASLGQPCSAPQAGFLPPQLRLVSPALLLRPASCRPALTAASREAAMAPGRSRLAPLPLRPARLHPAPRLSPFALSHSCDPCPAFALYMRTRQIHAPADVWHAEEHSGAGGRVCGGAGVRSQHQGVWRGGDGGVTQAAGERPGWRAALACLCVGVCVCKDCPGAAPGVWEVYSSTSALTLRTARCAVLRYAHHICCARCARWRQAAVMRAGLNEMRRFAKALYPSVRDETFFESCGVADLIGERPYCQRPLRPEDNLFAGLP